MYIQRRTLCTEDKSVVRTYNIEHYCVATTIGRERLKALRYERFYHYIVSHNGNTKIYESMTGCRFLVKTNATQT